MDFLIYLGRTLIALGFLQGLFGLLMAWFWPRFYENTYIARFYAHKLVGGQRKHRTWYACWLMTSCLTSGLLHLNHLMAGFVMLGVFLYFCYLLRDKIYLHNSA